MIISAAIVITSYSIHYTKLYEKEQIEGNIDIEFLIENASLLIDMIKNYTEKLAEGNSFEITDYEPQNAEEIICLQHYLNIQKQVFDQCA